MYMNKLNKRIYQAYALINKNSAHLFGWHQFVIVLHNLITPFLQQVPAAKHTPMSVPIIHVPPHVFVCPTGSTTFANARRARPVRTANTMIAVEMGIARVSMIILSRGLKCFGHTKMRKTSTRKIDECLIGKKEKVGFQKVNSRPIFEIMKSYHF